MGAALKLNPTTWHRLAADKTWTIMIGMTSDYLRISDDDDDQHDVENDTHEADENQINGC